MFYALVIRESCDHCRLRPVKLDWNVDRERLLCKLGRGILFSKRQITMNSKEQCTYILKLGWENLISHCALKPVTSLLQVSGFSKTNTGCSSAKVSEVLRIRIDCKAVQGWTLALSNRLLPYQSFPSAEVIIIVKITVKDTAWCLLNEKVMQSSSVRNHSAGPKFTANVPTHNILLLVLIAFRKPWYLPWHCSPACKEQQVGEGGDGRGHVELC